MPTFHVEVHTKDRQVEHYIALECESEEEARERAQAYYNEQKIILAPSLDVALQMAQVQHYIFQVVELESAPLIFVAGEYRSSFPV